MKPVGTQLYCFAAMNNYYYQSKPHNVLNNLNVKGKHN